MHKYVFLKKQKSNLPVLLSLKILVNYDVVIIKTICLARHPSNIYVASPLGPRLSSRLAISMVTATTTVSETGHNAFSLNQRCLRGMNVSASRPAPPFPICHRKRILGDRLTKQLCCILLANDKAIAQPLFAVHYLVSLTAFRICLFGSVVSRKELLAMLSDAGLIQSFLAVSTQ